MSISLRSIVSWQNASNEACNVHKLEAVADEDEVVADEEAASNEEAANEEEVTDEEAVADEVEVAEVTVEVGVDLTILTNDSKQVKWYL